MEFALVTNFTSHHEVGRLLMISSIIILHSFIIPPALLFGFMNGRKLRLLFDVLGSRKMCCNISDPEGFLIFEVLYTCEEDSPRSGDFFAPLYLLFLLGCMAML